MQNRPFSPEVISSIDSGIAAVPSGDAGGGADQYPDGIYSWHAACMGKAFFP